MRLEYQILIAFGLDLLLGDPVWLPHPVKIIGRCALRLETPCRKLIPNAWLAGIIVWMIIVGCVGGIAWAIIVGAEHWHPIAADVISILLLYTTIAAHDLARHSHNVYKALKAGDLPEARKRVSLIVGRDTERLDEPGVVRAAVESVAENMVDGVTAPIFFGVIGGPVGALIYKAINTLDSTFGYKTERYLKFGWASARLDDVANYIPARLTALLVAPAAAILFYRPVQALRICWRDGRKHESPNSGLSEAAVAGALGLQLGGQNYYDGEAILKPFIGEPIEPPHRDHIWRANALMFITSILALLLFVSARYFAI
ncbi:MAG: adenosylcobinamide-phosphate synthase CbiB [Planctomycetota bacterium]